MSKDKFSSNESFRTLKKLQFKVNELFGDKASNIKMSDSMLSFEVNGSTYIISRDNFNPDNRHQLVCDELDVFISDIFYLNRLRGYLAFVAKEVA